jgi:hypothetical protein
VQRKGHLPQCKYQDDNQNRYQHELDDSRSPLSGPSFRVR